MPCFGRSSEEKRIALIPSICIHCAFPPEPERYLPKLTEIKIQTEPHDIIDDPSSIFFDPNEKPGFVYTARAESVILDKQLTLTLPESKHEQIKNANNDNNRKANGHISDRERQISISSEYADSLDRSPTSVTTSPLRGGADADTYNEHHYRQVSRQDSLEFDPIVDGPISQITLNNKDYLHRPAVNATTAGLSEDDVRKLSSYEPYSYIDDFNDLHIYEEDILNDIAKNNGIHSNSNKGYLSDAESVKTYQDSGIYDDDVIMDSPSRTSQRHQSDVFHRSHDDDDEDDEHEMQMEKYSAFKTPMSSRHNSLEYLALESPMKILQQMKDEDRVSSRVTDTSVRGELPTTETNDGAGDAASENDSLDIETLENILDLENSDKRRKNDKYSHIQAKVQCFRRKGERSPSPGAALRKRTPECPKSTATTTTTNLKRSQSRGGVKPKVDSFNIKYTPGGGTTKVFKEKLKFRENAQPRTDTHGIEMYAHLPTEFQEIARRLARQDNQLKEQQKSRGRALSRSKSTAGRQESSRSPKRGRSRTKKNVKTENNKNSDVTNADASTNGGNGGGTKQAKKSEPVASTKPPCLSRSSSIRSVPTAPKISQRHPSSSKISRTPKSQSPGANSSHNDTSTSKGKKRDSSKSKDVITNTTPPKMKESLKSKVKENTSPKSAKENTVTSLKTKENTSPKTKENIIPKSKENTINLKENTSKLKDITTAVSENTIAMKEKSSNLNTTIDTENSINLNDSLSNESHVTIQSVKEPESRPTTLMTETVSTAKSDVTSLCQYISENESFGLKPLLIDDDLLMSSCPVLSDLATAEPSSHQSQLNVTNTRYQTVSAH